MYRHIVLLKLHADHSELMLQRVIETIATLQQKIPDVRRVEVGVGGPAAGEADLAVIIDLDNEEAFLRYDSHAAHHAAVDLVTPMVLERNAISYTVD
ncbi:Dabb family protein [Jatrophihabitans sp. DSM 45814]